LKSPREDLANKPSRQVFPNNRFKESQQLLLDLI